MISWLVSQLLPVSLLCLLLIVSHKVVLQVFGAVNKYYLWAIIPLALLLSLVGLEGANIINNGVIYHYVINVQAQVQSASTPQWLTWFWLAGSVFF